MDKENDQFTRKSSRSRADQMYNENENSEEEKLAIFDDSGSNFSDEEIKSNWKKAKLDNVESSESDSDNGNVIATKSMKHKPALRPETKQSTSAKIPVAKEVAEMRKSTSIQEYFNVGVKKPSASVFVENKETISIDNEQDDEISTPKLAPNPFFKKPGSSASGNM